MEIDLLVQEVSNIKEVKASCILAHMDVKKSREISQVLADQTFKIIQSNR